MPKAVLSLLIQWPLLKNEFFNLFVFFSEFYLSVAVRGAIIFHLSVIWQNSRKPAVVVVSCEVAFVTDFYGDSCSVSLTTDTVRYMC